MSTPADTGFDFTTVTGSFTEKLRAPRTAPVPESVVKLAQLSYDGQPAPTEADPGRKLHVLHYTFPSEAMRDAFVKHMKNAGPLTTPPTSVSIAVDPDATESETVTDEKGNTVTRVIPVEPLKVSWRATLRKGRGAASANGGSAAA